MNYSQTNMAAQRLSMKGISKFAKLQLSTPASSKLALASPTAPITMLKVKLLFNLFGFFTSQFDYAAPHLLPGTTVVVEATFASPPVAVNFRVFVGRPPALEIELV